MPKTEDDKGAKIKWDFPNPPITPKPSAKTVPPFPIKPETSAPQVETVVSKTSTQTRSSQEPDTQVPPYSTANPEAAPEAEESSQPHDVAQEIPTAQPSTHWISHFMATAGVSVALLLCIGLIFSLGFLLWHSMQRQNRLEDSVIESERRQASAMNQLKDDLVSEAKNTRAIVQERVTAIDSSQAILEKKFMDSERRAAQLQEQIETLSKNFIQEKQARENEMALLLNLTRVRINSIEKRQQELEKSSDSRGNR